METFANAPSPLWCQWSAGACALEDRPGSLTLSSRGMQAASNFESDCLMPSWQVGDHLKGEKMGVVSSALTRGRGSRQRVQLEMQMDQKERDLKPPEL